MATKITKIQVRRDTSSNWITANPTLSVGEIGFEQDSYRFKIGYDNLDWQNLPYFSGQGIIANKLAEVLDSGNFAPEHDAIIKALRLTYNIGADGKVETGGLAGDLLPAKSYFTSDRGIKTEIMNLEGSNLGDTNNRFKSGHFQGKDGKGTDFLVFGQESGDVDVKGTGTLSYIAQPTEHALGVINDVDEIGRVLSVSIALSSSIGNNDPESGVGYYVTEGVPTKYTDDFDPSNGTSTGGLGKGLRLNITNVDTTGAITSDGLEINDAGYGYEKNQKFIVVLDGKLILNAESGDTLAGEGEDSALVTKRDLKQLNTEDIPTGAQSMITIGRGKSDIRTLPDTDFIENAEDFDMWTYRSLVQHEYLKPTVRDCVNNGPLQAEPLKPEDFNFLDPGVNPIAIINVQGSLDKTQIFNPEWGAYIAGKVAYGGEILIWDPTAPVTPGDVSGNRPEGAWLFAFRPGNVDDGPIIEEEDPIFVSSAAYNIESMNVIPVDADGSLNPEFKNASRCTGLIPIRAESN